MRIEPWKPTKLEQRSFLDTPRDILAQFRTRGDFYFHGNTTFVACYPMNILAPMSSAMHS